MTPLRIGQGFDVHQLAEDRKLIIGGVTIPFEKGLLGHSDADVLLHAICDALLGAAALGDIGGHFSDADPRFKNIDSRGICYVKLIAYLMNMAIKLLISMQPLLPRHQKWPLIFQT